MRYVIAVVKPFRAAAVLAELAKLEVAGVGVTEARGYGRQKDQLPRYREGEYGHVYLPKIEIRILVRAEDVEAVVAAVRQAARTGRIGDGKLTVLPVEGVVSF